MVVLKMENRVGLNPCRWFGVRLIACMLAATRFVSAAAVDFRDDFSDPQLSEGWTIIREDPSTYSLTANPGFFRVQTVRGILGKDGTIRNLLVRPMSGDFILETRVEFDPRDGRPFAGLFSYQDDTHAVAIVLLYASGVRGKFRGVIMLNVGEGIDPAANPIAARYDESNADDPAVVYLRLLRQGDQFVGAYSADGVSYRDLGTVTNPLANDISVGIGAATGVNPECGSACDASIPADFDYFQITSFDSDPPPVDLVLDSVVVTGPSSVVGGRTARYTATANYSDGSSVDVTEAAEWLFAPTERGTIDGGLVTSADVATTQTATVVATYSEPADSGDITRTGAIVIRVTPAGLQTGLPRPCGAGAAAFLPFALVPIIYHRKRRQSEPK